MDDLTNALVETGATIAFDAIRQQARGADPHLHGGRGQQDRQEYSRYGSNVYKQVYICG
jgi:hypothetical protein